MESRKKKMLICNQVIFCNHTRCYHSSPHSGSEDCSLDKPKGLMRDFTNCYFSALYEPTKENGERKCIKLHDTQNN